MLAAFGGVKSRFSSLSCAVALLLYIPVSHVLYLLPPCLSWLCWASKQQNPTKQNVLFLSELFRGFVLVGYFIHLIFLVSEHSTKSAFGTGDLLVILSASYLRSCHFNFWQYLKSPSVNLPAFRMKLRMIGVPWDNSQEIIENELTKKKT